MRGLEHRAAKVSMVNGLSTMLTLIIQLAALPVCLRYWGKETYGSWLTLFSAYMLLRSLDGGYVAYVGNKLNYLYHTDTQALREHLSSAAFGILVVGSCQVALAGGTLVAGPVAAALGVGPALGVGAGAKLGLLTLIVSWVLSGSYLGIVHRLMIPAGLMSQAAWWGMELQACQFLALMAGAVLRLDLLQTSALFALSQALSYAAAALYVRRKLPGFTPWLRGARARTGLQDLGHSLFITAGNLIQQGGTNGAVVLVSVLAGPAAVPLFTTVRTVANLWTMVTTVLSTPLLPDVVRLHARGEVRKLVEINRTYWVLIGSAVNLGALLTYPSIPWLYGVWTSHSVPLDKPLLCLLLGSVVAANAGALMSLHLNGINSLRIVLLSAVVRTVLTLGIGVLGFRALGIASFGAGILSGEIAATLATAHYFVKHEVSAKGSRMSARDFGPVGAGTGAALVFFSGAGFGWWSVGWVWWMAVAGVCAAFVWGWKSLNTDLQFRLRSMAVVALRL